MATNADLEQRIREIAADLAREFEGIEEEQNSCLMTRIEDLASEIGDSLAGRLMEQRLESRDDEDVLCCPYCEKPSRLKGRRKRAVETKRGPIEITEPEYYCRRCRKAFFPSLQTTGDDT